MIRLGPLFAHIRASLARESSPFPPSGLRLRIANDRLFFGRPVVTYPLQEGGALNLFDAGQVFAFVRWRAMGMARRPGALRSRESGNGLRQRIGRIGDRGKRSPASVVSHVRAARAPLFHEPRRRGEFYDRENEGVEGSDFLERRRADRLHFRFDSDRLGKLAETVVFAELMAEIDASDDCKLFHYRDWEQRELDVLVERRSDAAMQTYRNLPETIPARKASISRAVLILSSLYSARV